MGRRGRGKKRESDNKASYATRYNGCSVSRDAPRTDRTHASRSVASCCTWQWPSAVGRQQVPLETGVGKKLPTRARNRDPLAREGIGSKGQFFNSRNNKKKINDG